MTPDTDELLVVHDAAVAPLEVENTGQRRPGGVQVLRPGHQPGRPDDSAVAAAAGDVSPEAGRAAVLLACVI